MRQENVMYFDEMDLPQREIEKRIAACNKLEADIAECFDWLENHLDEAEEESVYSLFGSRMRIIFVAWAISIGLFGELELSDLASQIYQESGFNVYDVIDPGEDSDAENDDNPSSAILLPGATLFLEVLGEIKDYIEDIDQIVENTRKHIEETYYVSQKRAQRIAQDETNKRFNKMWHSENASVHEYHQWAACNDRYTRDSHRETSGQIKPIDEPFEVNGYFMMYPMDVSYGAPIGEIVGCRCTEVFW